MAAQTAGNQEDGDWNQGDDDNSQEDHGEMFFDKRNSPEEVTNTATKRDPDSHAEEISQAETVPWQVSRAGNQGDKGPNEGDEATKGDCHQAVTVEELPGFLKVGTLDPLTEPRPADQPPANVVVEGVAKDGGNKEDGN